MATYQGSYGLIADIEDFVGVGETTWGTGVGALGRVAYTSVNEGSFAMTVDEPGGILAVTTDTADNDNFAAFVGPFKPADGRIFIEARLKVGSVAAAKTAVNVGFTQVLDKATPVMPFEFATATLTINGSANDAAAMFFDTDATTITWRFASQKAAAVTGDANGTNSGVAPVADRWDILRVEIDPNGTVRGYLNGTLVKETASAVTATDIQHGYVMIENRDGNAEVMEVDYIAWSASRDWDQA